MTTTAAPTIRDVVLRWVPPSAQYQYRDVIEHIVADLETRERRLFAEAEARLDYQPGDPGPASEHPIEDEILRRLDENASSMSKKERIESLEADLQQTVARVRDLEGRVNRMDQFARRYGYTG